MSKSNENKTEKPCLDTKLSEKINREFELLIKNPYWLDYVRTKELELKCIGKQLKLYFALEIVQIWVS